jgi:hypothetical protein
VRCTLLRRTYFEILPPTHPHLPPPPPHTHTHTHAHTHTHTRPHTCTLPPLCRQVRPGAHQLCQPRHGGPHRRPGGHQELLRPGGQLRQGGPRLPPAQHPPPHHASCSLLWLRGCALQPITNMVGKGGRGVSWLPGHAHASPAPQPPPHPPAAPRPPPPLPAALQELLEVVDELKGRFIVTSDHGNADDMAQVGSRRAAGRFVDALAGGRRAAGWTRWRAAPRLACSTGVCAPSTRHQLLHACLPPCLPPPVARQEDSEANHAGGQGRVADVAHPGARCAPLVFACPVPAMSLSNEGGRRALCTHHSSLDTLPVF